MVLGLVFIVVSFGHGNRLCGGFFWLVPSGSGRLLVRLRVELPVGESQRAHPVEPVLRPWFPPGEDLRWGMRGNRSVRSVAQGRQRLYDRPKEEAVGYPAFAPS